MRSCLLFLVLALAPLTMGAQSPATPASKAHARVTLIADSTTLARGGEPTWMGVRFRLDPGWHIYWRNPGESGSPPNLEWSLFPTRRMGGIEWPTPIRLVTGGEISYGYESEVVLLAPLRLSSGPAGGLLSFLGNWATVSADVTYVICREICLMEKASPGMDVQDAANKQPSADAALIAEWRKRVPKTMPSTWRATAKLADGSWALTLDTGLVLHLKTSPFFSTAPTALDGVIVLSGGSAFSVHAPLRATFAPGAVFSRNYSRSNFLSEEVP